MSTSQRIKFHSPFIWNTFSSTLPESKQTVYQHRLIELYREQYPILNDFTTEQINSVLESRKLKEFELTLQKEKEDKEKEENAKKADENNANNAEQKDDKKEDIPNNTEVDEKDQNEKEAQPNATVTTTERILQKDEKRLIHALELMETEYYGNEHALYVYLCQKYDSKIKAIYTDNINTITDKLMENRQYIQCAECLELKDFTQFSKNELLNGYFAACKECEPDRDSVQTLKWSPNHKSHDVVLKHNNFLATVNRNGHRYACIDINHPAKVNIALLFEYISVVAYNFVTFKTGRSALLEMVPQTA